MLSIICCSIKPEAALSLKYNIEKSIGKLPYEFIAFDNRATNYGICEVYNLCASKAKYDYLCFVHEDVCFDTINWGEIIIQQLKKEKCGVIGFAGSILKLKRLTGWNTCYKDMRANYIQHMKGKKHYHRINPDNLDFTPVITLDGLCLFVSRSIWKNIKFDQQTFNKFHCYDIDFSLSVAIQYQNYVCNNIIVQHYSQGAFSEEWLKDLERLHKKWQDKLPLYIKKELTSKQLIKYDRLGECTFLKFLMQKGMFNKCSLKHVTNYIFKYPLYATSWLLYLKYIKYRLRYHF